MEAWSSGCPGKVWRAVEGGGGWAGSTGKVVLTSGQCGLVVLWLLELDFPL